MNILCICYVTLGGVNPIFKIKQLIMFVIQKKKKNLNCKIHCFMLISISFMFLVGSLYMDVHAI